MNSTGQKADIGVRYCGGCNPTYDRVKVVKKLEKLLPELSFERAQPGKSYAAVLIVNGCFNACTSTLDIAVPRYRQINICSFSDLIPARDRIRELLTEEEARTLDRAGIEAILPHRPPMLFVDAVTRLIPGKECAAELDLDPDWEVFKGHFPDQPVFPGVLAVEAMAQTADLMAMTKETYAGKLPLLMEVGRARFLRRLLPGCRARINAAIKDERPEAGIVVCRCQILEEDALCAEAEITLAMR